MESFVDISYAHRLFDICLTGKSHTSSDAVLDTQWLATEVIKRVGERAYIKTGLKLFREQEKEVLQRARDLFGKKADPVSVAVQLFDLNAWNDRTVELYGPLTSQSIVQGYRTAARRVGVDIPFPPGDTRAKAIALEVLGKAQGVNSTTQGQIADAVLKWQESGEGISGLTDRLEERFGIARNKAATIAQTTATPVFESGQQLGFKDAGIKTHGWLSRRDADVRQQETGDHVDADGQFVPIDEAFFVTGESLRFPGDPAGSPGNVINCRCTQMPGEFE